MVRFYGVVMAAALLAAPVWAVEWAVDKGTSKLTWVATFNKQPITGEFKDWNAAIVLDEANLATAKVKVEVRTASVESGDPERDSALQGKDFFNSAATPLAVFESQNVRKTPQGYEAVGTLTLAGVSKPAVLPFTLETANGKATAQGVLKLNRQDYAVGKGAWAKASEIGNDVDVHFTVHATAAE